MQDFSLILNIYGISTDFSQYKHEKSKIANIEYLSVLSSKKFLKIDVNMKSLRILDLDFTATKELPSTIGCLSDLAVLDHEGCTNLISLPSTIYLLPNLRHLRLNGCSGIEMLLSKWDPTNDPECSSPNH